MEHLILDKRSGFINQKELKNCRNCKYLIQGEEYREVWDDGGDFFPVLNCEKYQDLSISDLDNECRDWEKFEIEE